MLQYFCVIYDISKEKGVKYGYKGLNKIRNKIQSKELKEKGRKSLKDFTRKRKMDFGRLIYSQLIFTQDKITKNFFVCIKVISIVVWILNDKKMM